MRDGSVMAHSDLIDFLSGSTDSAINFSGSADLHIPIHPPLKAICISIETVPNNENEIIFAGIAPHTILAALQWRV